MLRGTILGILGMLGSGVAAALFVGRVSLGLAQGASASSLFPFQTIALSGQAAPGMPAGATWDHVGVARLNAGGDAIFLGRVVGGGTTAADDGGIWTRSASCEAGRPFTSVGEDSRVANC